MTRNEHTPFIENIPAYATGALDADEVTALESHLQTCASCRSELADYRALGESLLTAVPPALPSAALRKRLQSQLPAAGKSARLRLNWSFGNMAMGAALLLLLIMNVYSITQVQSLQLAQTQLVSQYQTGETILSMLSYPATQRLAISSDTVVGSLLLDKDRNIVALIVWNMPQLQDDETYQIWLVAPNGDRVSAGVFRPEIGQRYTTQVTFPKQSLSNFTGIGVTVEPAGGSDQPTGERVLKVDF